MAESAFQSTPIPSPPLTSPHSRSALADTRSFLSSPSSTPIQVSQHDYNFSPREYDESSATEEEHVQTDEEMARLNAETNSSRSSISSLPASVAPSVKVLPQDGLTPTKRAKLTELRGGSLSNEAKRRNWRDSPFRNPSSVRSIQLRDEEEDVVLHHHKRTSKALRNTSTFSTLSFGSPSQPQRLSGKHSQFSPKKSKVKKEFPLVLLHCSLLPPSLPTKARVSDTALLQTVLPEEYWRRWEVLTDRITNDHEIQSRGVLIPHPKADYDLLEERLLESLELATPRIRSGHYYGNENVSEVEESESDAETAVQGTKCQDCGKRVVQDAERDRKWEVKVYAANGLMRAGAWSAAWNEMEKVDVEVNVYFPEDVRREVEERFLHLGLGHDIEEEVREPELTESEIRRREIYGGAGRDPQEKVDGFFEPNDVYDDGRHEQFTPHHESQQYDSTPTIELKQLLVNYIKVLARDKRNIVIGILGLAILLFALRTPTSPQQAIDRQSTPIDVSVASSSSVPRCTYSPTSAALSRSDTQSVESLLTSMDTVTSTEQGPPVKSIGESNIDLQVPLLPDREEVGSEISSES